MCINAKKQKLHQQLQQLHCAVFKHQMFKQNCMQINLSMAKTRKKQKTQGNKRNSAPKNNKILVSQSTTFPNCVISTGICSVSQW